MNIPANMRPVLPGMLLLLMLALSCITIGIYITISLPRPGDRALLFLYATVAWPGPYFVYMIFCLFVFHSRRSLVLTLTFYLSCLLMALACVILINDSLTGSRLLAERLEQALFHNFIAVTAIALISAAMLYMFMSFTRHPENGNSL